MSTEAPSPMDLQIHRKLAVEFFNQTWTLLDKSDRSPEEDARMIHSAHASRLHWELAAGSAQNIAIGEWQVSRVHAVLRQPDAVLYHARSCLDIAERNARKRPSKHPLGRLKRFIVILMHSKFWRQTFHTPSRCGESLAAPRF